MKDFIGLDLGTSNLKGVLIGEGGILAKACREVDFLHPAVEQSEIDPESYFAIFCSLIRELADQSKDGVAGISAAAASGNTLLVDSDGSAASNIISWLDSRKESVNLDPETVYNTVGWPLLPCFPPVHLQYFMRSGALRGKHVSMSNDYVISRLTGKDVLDVSSGTPFYLIDQAKRSYSAFMTEAFGLLSEQLPFLCESGDMIGYLLPKFCGGGLTAETKVFAGCFDHPAAARAVRLQHENELLLSCGTSWVTFSAVPRRTLGPGILSDPYLSGNGGPWGCMRSLAQAGLRLEEMIVEKFGNGTDRYLRFQENAHRKDVEEVLADLGRRFIAIMPEKVNRIYMVGGSAQDEVCPSLIAKMANCPVLVPDFHLYAGSVGAATLAGAPAQTMNCKTYLP